MDLSAAGVDAASVRPLSRDEYDKLVELGVFEDERVELLYGRVVYMTPTGPDHDGPIGRLTKLLILALGDQARVRVQSAFAASDDSQPQPDLAVVPEAEYDDAHPREAYLLVEVSQSSLKRDRGLKATLYAESNVEEYWIVNVRDELIEVYRDPVQGSFTRVTPYRRGESITLSAFEDVSIAVSDVLRPA